MLSINTHQFAAWAIQLLWPFLRIGACLMVAPAFAAVSVPSRVRIVLAGAIALLIAPLLPPVTGVTVFSGEGFVVAVQQLIVGVAMGFSMQLVFDAVTLGGQLLSNSMGLSFAMNVDPVRGTSTPALGDFYSLLVMLTFLALNGHLRLLDVLAQSFTTLPVGVSGLGRAGLWQVATWGTQLFSSALIIALPGVAALLIVNIAFGVVSRAAPSMNLFAVGFPVTLIFGLVILFAGLPALQSTFVRQLAAGFRMLFSLLRIGG